MLDRNEIFLRLSPSLYETPKNMFYSLSLRLAAVLVIIHYRKGIPHILLTKRSSRTTLHSNEISFPGGSFDKADKSIADTAIRETKEEIGLYFQQSDLIGHLDTVQTLTSNFIIYPFVTLQDKILLRNIPNDEVQDIIDVPLLETLKTIDKDHCYSSFEDAYRFLYGSDIIWGATARILKKLYDCLCIKDK